MSQEQQAHEALDKRYQQSAVEQPSNELDKAILEEAFAHAKPNKSAWLKWERLASVAAVMVLTVTIFFDVRETRDNELQDFSPAPNRHTPALDSVSEKFDDESKTSAPKTMAAQPAREAAIAGEVEKSSAKAQRKLQDERLQKRASTQALKRMTAKHTEESTSLKITSQMKGFTGLEPATVDVLINEIQALINAGELKLAEEKYSKLIETHPQADIPVDIQLLFEGTLKSKAKSDIQ